MKKLLLTASIPALLLISSCKCKDKEEFNPQTATVILSVDMNLKSPSITKGFYGFLTEWKGDFMPPPPYNGTIDSVKRDIYVYKETTFDEIRQARIGFIFWSLSNMPFKPLYIIKTNGYGFFEADLPAGTYSLFILVDGNRLYRNSISGRNGVIGKIVVDDNSLIQHDLKIDYEASY